MTNNKYRSKIKKQFWSILTLIFLMTLIILIFNKKKVSFIISYLNMYQSNLYLNLFFA